MRKLILISAFALASVSAQASEISNLLAANDVPVAAATATPPAAATADAASRKQASRSRKPQRETDEQKARRIAGKYGITW